MLSVQYELALAHIDRLTARLVLANDRIVDLSRHCSREADDAKDGSNNAESPLD
jgi:hypothetical protein